MQENSPRGVLLKMCSDKFRKIQWKTLALKLLFNNFCFVMRLCHQGIARSRSCWKDVRGDCGGESLWQWFQLVLRLNPLSANPTKWSNTLKTIRPLLRRIVWVCLTILWGWLLKVYAFCRSPILQKQFIITSVGCFYRGSSFSEHYFLKIPERS